MKKKFVEKNLFLEEALPLGKAKFLKKPLHPEAAAKVVAGAAMPGLPLASETKSK